MTFGSGPSSYKGESAAHRSNELRASVEDALNVRGAWRERVAPLRLSKYGRAEPCSDFKLERASLLLAPLEPCGNLSRRVMASQTN
jgi:hypothetical protein